LKRHSFIPSAGRSKLLLVMATATVAVVAILPSLAAASAASDADLTLYAQGAPDPTSVNGTLTYSIQVYNNGPDGATGVVMTDPLPASVTFQSVTPASPTCANSSGTVTCNLGTMAAFHQVDITITVTPHEGGIIHNTPGVTSSSNDPNPDDNSPTVDTTVNEQATADVGLSLADNPDPVVQGRTLHYSIDVYNYGPDTATGVTVTDTLPSSMTFLSSTPPSPTCVSSSGTVTCSVGSLTKDQQYTITLNVRANTVGAINNTASVSGSSLDQVTTNDSATQDTTVNPAPVLPKATISNASVKEGDAGKRGCSFTVKLSAPFGSAVTVHYATANGTAKAPGDYGAKSGTLTFAAGSTSHKLPILVKGDNLNESNELFSVKLSNPNNARLGSPSTGKCTIRDDD
jgi:uncharacterized repeat protein (TIGR01451 family)